MGGQASLPHDHEAQLDREAQQTLQVGCLRSMLVTKLKGDCGACRSFAASTPSMRCAM